MGKRVNTKRRNTKRRNKIIKGGRLGRVPSDDQTLDDIIKFILEFIQKFSIPLDDPHAGFTDGELAEINNKATTLWMEAFK